MEANYNKQITELLNLFEQSDLTSMFVEFDGVRIIVNKNGEVLAPVTWEAPAVTPVAAPAIPAPARAQAPPLPAAAPKQTAASAAAEPDLAGLEGLHVVRAPMLGTFYRSPSPGEPPFITEGSQVMADQTLCLIECMKLFNTIPVGVKGRLVRFAVENGTLVEFEQPIAYIQPE